MARKQILVLSRLEPQNILQGVLFNVTTNYILFAFHIDYVSVISLICAPL